MSLSYDLFWSFRSPYSYLLTPRLVELERDHDVRCNVRVVYPIAVRQPEFFDHADPLWQSYFMTDVFRSAQFLGLPLRWPRPDPVVRDRATGKYPREQPYIHRLTRLGVAATEAGKGLPFLDCVSRLIWNGKTDNWHEGDYLGRAAAEAGLDLGKLDATIAAKPDHYEASIAANEQAQRAAGHYGVPLLAFDDEPFFGQDRFDQFKWRLMRKGLRQRSA